MRSGRSLVLVGGLLALSTHARAQPPCGPYCDVPDPGYVYDLQITDVKSVGSAIVEHEPIDVRYTLVVTPYGIVSTPPPLTSVRVCPTVQADPSTCRDVGVPRVRRTHTGTVRMAAPAAGKAAPVTLVALKAPLRVRAGEQYGWEPVAEQTKQTPVAARYEVAVEGFEIFHTRSTDEDTIRVNLQSMVKTEPPLPPHVSDTDSACTLAEIRWCAMGIEAGDVDDGKHPVGNVRVGPYLLVPEAETELRVLYTVYNYGETYTQAMGEAIANGFSKVGMIILMGAATTGSSVATQLDEGMQKLHGAMFAGCDGITAADEVTVRNRAVAEAPNATLDGLTRGTGVYRPAPTKHYYERDGNTVCGPGGDYTVTYAVHRTSWRAQ